MKILLSALKQTSNTLSCRVETDLAGIPHELFFRCDPANQHLIHATYDCCLLAILPLAMAVCAEIEIEGTIDSQLYENVLEGMGLIHSWFPNRYQTVAIRHQGLRYNYPATKGKTASFFSGGVDSLFNIAAREKEQLDEVDLCILVRGMDISLDNDELWEETSKRITANLHSYSNVDIVSVETNARLFQSKRVVWTECGFGPLLGAVSNFLSCGVTRFVIGSYGKYEDVVPHGSNPLLDRLWSSTALQVVHYSARFSRLEKIKLLRDYAPSLLAQIRVCWKNPDNVYNCGLCEKCLRTKSELAVAGASDICKSFGEYDLASDLVLLSGQIPMDNSTKVFWRRISRELPDPNLRRTIQNAILLSYCRSIGHKCRNAWKKLKRFFR